LTERYDTSPRPACGPTLHLNRSEYRRAERASQMIAPLAPIQAFATQGTPLACHGSNINSDCRQRITSFCSYRNFASVHS